MGEQIGFSVYVENDGYSMPGIMVTIKWHPVSVLPSQEFYSEYTDSSGHAYFTVEKEGDYDSVTIYVSNHEEGPYFPVEDGDSFTIDTSDS